MTKKLTVIYDACVLYPNTLRDILMELAVRDIWRFSFVRGTLINIGFCRCPRMGVNC